MTSDGFPIVIGLGCSSAATPAEIVALVEACCREANVSLAQATLLATHTRRLGSQQLWQAAAALALPLHFLDDEDLAPGVPGTCEAVAAAAGPLLLGKRKSRYATCAIATCAPGFNAAAFGQAVSPRAATASSTVATSSAGP